MLIPRTTRVDLHRIARASRAPYTPAMADFLIGLPVDWTPATDDEIEAFDALLDEMEDVTRLDISINGMNIRGVRNIFGSHRMTYAWIITKDYITPEGEVGHGVGVMGPYGVDRALAKELDNKADAGEAFAMYDDDGELYYRGRIVGDYEGFEPLDDYGMPNAGCTMIKYRNPNTGKWEIL